MDKTPLIGKLTFADINNFEISGKHIYLIYIDDVIVAHAETEKMAKSFIEEVVTKTIESLQKPEGYHVYREDSPNDITICTQTEYKHLLRGFVNPKHKINYKKVPRILEVEKNK